MVGGLATLSSFLFLQVFHEVTAQYASTDLGSMELFTTDYLRERKFSFNTTLASNRGGMTLFTKMIVCIAVVHDPVNDSVSLADHAEPANVG